MTGVAQTSMMKTEELPMENGRRPFGRFFGVPLILFSGVILLLFLLLHSVAGLGTGATLSGILVAITAGFVLVFVQDTRSREALRRTQASLREELSAAGEELSSHRNWATTLARLPDPLLLIESDGRISFANAATERLLQRPVVDSVMETAFRQPELLECVEEVLAGAAERVTEVTFAGPIERIYVAHVTELEEKAETSGRAALLLLHDLTAAKRAERLRADFVANASHELKTPLASLSGFIETLQGPARADADARERFLDVMSEQAARMARVIEDLLALSRIELEEHTPPTESIPLDDLVQSVAKELQPQADDKSIEIVTRSEKVAPVPGDLDELWRVFQNLIENAIKYGATESTVEISVVPITEGTADSRALGRSGASVSVRNEGEGVTPEHLPRLTERFYRVDTARSRQLGGTGLGLAIVKHIVNRHRGLLRIESRPGVDFTVTCLFPFLEGPKAS